jgi:hypothetical protein
MVVWNIWIIFPYIENNHPNSLYMKHMGYGSIWIYMDLYPYAPWCWYIYIHNLVIYGVNVSKYSIHGAYGIWIYMDLYPHAPWCWNIYIHNWVNTIGIPN